MGGSTQEGGPMKALIKSYMCMALWIALSGAVILINKWILLTFPFPLALGVTHMAFCSLLSAACVRLGLVEAAPMPASVYTRGVLPIGALFAAALWASNAAYLYLSVSFIQMIKATTPLLVYLVGAALGTERLERGALANMSVVVGGVMLASYAEVDFVLVGVVLQALALCAEAVRLVMVQLLLQGRGVKLNPVTTMYHVAPVCFAFLIVPFAALEARRIYDAGAAPPVGRLLASAAAAFALNYSVFLLIGRTSALTMNVAGVVKDWLLIAASVGLYKSVVTRLQVAGYAVAMAGVLWYNISKILKSQLAAAGANSSSALEGASCGRGGGGGGGGEQKQPLLVQPHTPPSPQLPKQQHQHP